MIDERTRILLEDMRDHANYALDYIAGLDPDLFTQTLVMVHAATRAAELSARPPRKSRWRFGRPIQTFPWRRVIDMRNKLIHGYRSLQPKTLYETIRDHFPPLITEIERILNAHP